MKKIISVLLVFTMLSSIVNVSFAEEVEQGSVISYGVSSISDKELNDIVTNIDTGMVILEINAFYECFNL